MEEKVNALMIKSVDYGENDKILTLFSLEKGVISAKIRGVKKAGAKLKFAAEPFCFAEYVLSGRGGMFSVIHASLHDGFFPLRLDVERLYAAGAAAEFVRRFCPENVVSAGLFAPIIECLKRLAYSSAPPSAPLAAFLAAGLKEIGYGLDLGVCPSCGGEISRPFFDFSSGAAYCAECREEGFTEIRYTTYRLLSALNERGYDESENYDGEVCRRALALISKYLKYNTSEDLRNIKEFLNLY